jgi:hypothetical protein
VGSWIVILLSSLENMLEQTEEAHHKIIRNPRQVTLNYTYVHTYVAYSCVSVDPNNYSGFTHELDPH